MKCAICGVEYEKQGGMVNHIQRTHKIKYKQYYDTYVEPGVEHKCIICGNEQAFYHGKYLLTCNDPHCVRMMQRNTMLNLYGKSCRSQAKIDKARVAKFGSLENYEKIQAANEAEKKCVCGICGKRYRSNGRLMVHVKTEHPDVTIESYYETYIDPTAHVCPCCGRKCRFGQFKFNKTCGSAECLSKYRSEHNAMNNPVYRKRAIDGNVNRTPEQKRESVIRREQTCLRKFGYKHNWSSPELREKGQYATCILRYGDKNYHNVPKMQETNMKVFGVRSFSQTLDFHTAKWHKIKYDGFTFDSTYEVKFYNILKYFNIPMEYHPSVKYEYEFNDEAHYYFPDFRFNGRTVDVKNDYLLKLMNTPNTKENAKLHCMLDNGVEVINGEFPLDVINFIFSVNVSEDSIVGLCKNTAFPGTQKWPANHPIWKSYVPGYKSPYNAWNDETLIRKAVKNMLKTLDDSLASGKYKSFCLKHIAAIVCFGKGKPTELAALILNRFTIAKIAPKVTALRAGELLNIIEESHKDLSNGVYCPMAGFGGIIDGVKQWFVNHGKDPTGKIEAYDINKQFCDWYGWTERDVLAQVITTDKTVVVCPPFGKRYEHWDGTPDEMSDIGFHKWVDLIKKHVVAPDYIFIGPELDNNSKSNACGLFKRKVGIQWYPDL